MSTDSDPPVDDDYDAFDPDADQDPRRLFERAVPEVFKRVLERAIEAGVEKLTEAPDNLRDMVSDMKIPKEAAGYFYEQIDDTKKGVYRVVAKEIRDVLEHINFADEIAQVLTKLQFEINTTIRFSPNVRAEEDDSDEAEGDEEAAKRRSGRIPRPKVVSKVVMKARDVIEDALERKPKDEGR